MIWKNRDEMWYIDRWIWKQNESLKRKDNLFMGRKQQCVQYIITKNVISHPEFDF